MTVDNVQDIYKLSPVQHGMLFHTLYAPEAGAYFYQFVLPFGPLHGPQVEQAWQRLVDRHTVLRTSFLWEDLDEPVQIVHKKVKLHVQEEDWSHLEPAEQRTRLAAFCRADRRLGFDLNRAPLMRVTVIRMSAQDHQVVWGYHHLILDGWSMSLVMRELITIYQATLRGQPPQLAAPRPFRDYIRWLNQQDLAAAETYWQRTLEGIREPTPLAIDLAPGRPPGPDETYRVVKLNIAGDDHQRLKTLCRQHRLTIANVVQGAWALMLARYSGRADLVFGITVSGRPAEIPGVESMIGNFINTLPARAQIDGNEAVVPWLVRLQREQLERKKYEYSPLVDIRTWCHLPADQPLFEAILVFERYGLATPGRSAAGGKQAAAGQQEDAAGQQEEREEPESFQRTNYPLAAVVRPKEDELGLSIGYDRSRFETAAMERMLRHMAMLLQCFTEGDETPLAALPALPKAEQRQLLSWNDTAADYPRDTPIHALVAAQAARAPQAPAVTFAGQTLTYGELKARADRLAARLVAHGVGVGSNETLVGLCLERSADMVVAALAVLTAGGAYVPLDPAYPAERLAFVVEDAGIRTLLTHAHLRELLPGEGVKRLVLDDDTLDDDALDEAAALPLPNVTTDRLAYVIYTSGSTGRPKGVQITHRCFANFLHTMRQRPGLAASDVLLAVTTLSFDIAGLELFLPLTTGAQVVVAAQEDILDGRRLGTMLDATGSTVMQATPATWRLLLQSGWGGRPGLRVLCGGEALPRDLAEQLLASGVTLWNVYGPTETTVWSTTTEVTPGDGAVTIGRPIANTTLYTLDRGGASAPIGVPGELMIGGDGVARGYLGRPGLTAERFVPDPFSGHPGARLYRTGDLARFQSDGDLDFLGRLDHQVKVRGFRIELGEIEAALADHPAVAQNAVLAREDTPGDQRLVAYIVPRQEGLPTPAALRGFLQNTLPDYMVPSVFVELEALPLTPNGKVDRRALPAPEGTRRDAGRTVAPRNDDEKAIAAVWQEVLGLEAVGIDESFFDLGGHSLLMVKVHNKLRGHFEREIDMVDLFRFPTIEALARHLSGEEEDADAAALRVRTRQGTSNGDVAIIGMAGRFPGARDLDAFWVNLRDGLETTSFFSDETLREAGVDEALLANPRYVKARPMLEDADWFDADFFDYTPREAQILDPQQRVFLECAWEALEHAGHDSDDRSCDVAVFAGAALNTHLMRFFANPALARSVGTYQVFISNDKDFLATRASYKLDLTGPSINVQTACSTALVGVCLACDSLLSGQSDVALAGGVSVKASQPSGYLYEPGGIVAPDGHTRAFDARGRGTIFGDGVGVVVLKRLEDALAAGDTIHAVVKGAALNNDGAHKVGFTAPSVEGQARAILSAQAQAGVGPEEISYIEAHGTGTELGDPIEVTALTQAFRRGAHNNGTDKTGYCALGTVKTNFGHLDTAAGAAGLIKTVLSLEHEAIPPSLGFDTPNPLIDFDASPFFVNTALRPWPRGEAPRRAGVSSFGIGGTNAHLIIEEAPPRPASPDAAPWQLLLLSAKTTTARDAMTTRLGAHLAAHPDLNLADVAFTLQAGRRVFPYRRAVVCRDVADAIAALGTGEEEGDSKQWRDAQQSASGRPVAFLFPGQGTQHVGMGRELYESETVFRQQVDAACEILKPHLDLDLRSLLYPKAENEDEAAARLAETRYTQPALFVIAHACARLWMSWGLEPAAMLGHSIGEYVAACLAGVFTLEDALALVAARGRMMQDLPAGAMLSVALEPADLEARLGTDLGTELDLAAVNGPALCVVSGPGDAVEAFQQALQEDGVDCRPLHTSHAFHSAMMEPILDTFRAAVEAVPRQAPTRRYLSNVSGTWITAEEAVDPAYWARHLRTGVRFADGLADLFQEIDGVLLEVGPGRALATLARRHPDRRPEHVIVTSLPHPKEPQGERPFLLGARGQLWLAGVDCDASAVHGNVQRRRLPLPTYPFERRRFWIETSRPAAAAETSTDASALLRSSPAAASPAGDESVDYTAPRDERERVIAALWQELIGIEQVGIHDNYFEIGGTSLLAVRLASRLRDHFDLELSPHFLLEAQTVAALAAQIGNELAANGEEGGEDRDVDRPVCLVTLQAGDSTGTGDGRRPLFLAHPVGGRVYFYRGLAERIGRDQAVYGLRAHGVAPGEEPLDTLEEMATAYVEAIRWQQPTGPYLLGGSSLGGIIAYEIAQQLHAAGERVDLLAMLDAPGRGHMPAPAADDAELLHRMFSQQAGLSLEALRARDAEDQLRYLVEMGRAAGVVPPEFDLEDAKRLVKVHKNATRAMLAYEPKPYPGAVLYFRARERREFETANPEAAWIDLVAGGTEVHLVPGDHITMHYDPHLPTLATRFRHALDRAHARIS